jgi:hypothetical protein
LPHSCLIPALFADSTQLFQHTPCEGPCRPSPTPAQANQPEPLQVVEVIAKRGRSRWAVQAADNFSQCQGTAVCQQAEDLPLALSQVVRHEMRS